MLASSHGLDLSPGHQKVHPRLDLVLRGPSYSWSPARQGAGLLAPGEIGRLLCEVYAYRRYHWHAWRYVERYAPARDAQGTLKEATRVLGDVDEAVRRILGAAEGAQRHAA